MPAQSLQCCLPLGDPMDCSPLGSSVHGISQARILEWVAISFSRGSSQQGLNPHLLRLLHCRQILLPLSPWGSPIPPFTSVHSPLLRDLNENLRFPVCLGNPSFLWGIPTFGHSGPSSSSAPDSPIPTQPMFLDTDVLAGWWGEILMAPKGCF